MQATETLRTENLEINQNLCAKSEELKLSQNAVVALTQELETLKDQTRQLHKSLEDNNAQAEEKERVVTALHADNESQSVKFIQLEQEKQAAEEQWSVEKRKKELEFEQQLKGEVEKLAHLQAQNTTLESELVVWKEKQAHLADQLKVITTQHEAKMEEIAKFVANEADSNRRITETEKCLQEQRALLTEEKQQNEALLEQIRLLETANTYLMEQATTVEKTDVELNQKVASLEQSIIDTCAQLEAKESALVLLQTELANITLSGEQREGEALQKFERAESEIRTLRQQVCIKS